MKKLSLPMKRMLQITLLVLGLIIGGRFAVIAYTMFTKMRNFEPPAQTINTTTVRAMTHKPVIATIGSVRAVNGAELKAQTTGIVQSVHFESGALVEKGQLLIQLNSDVENADLASAKAAAHLAELNAKRAQTLIQSKAISAAEFDNAVAQQDQTAAAVRKIEALIALKTIRAPFAGKAGIRLVNVGQYVDPATPLLSLQVNDPLYVEFSLPEKNLKQLAVGAKLSIQADGQEKIIEGKVNAVNSAISEQTRTVNVQGIVNNRDSDLYPGMFIKVNVFLKEEPNILVIPQTALDYSVDGETVYVLYDDKNKKGDPVKRVKHRIIHTAGVLDDQIIIKDGLTAGELIASSGQLKLQDGTQVVINNDVNISKSKSPTTAY